jgi:trans-2,3-dihydro-3-hydroxyanthranilate isomerase
MPLAYVVVDVFTDTPLGGNQLAVFKEAPGLTGTQMQRLARELNLSETVFLAPSEDGGDARVRIFTPDTELPFAGHPVLGTAVVIAEARGLERVVLETVLTTVEVALEMDGGKVKFGRLRQGAPPWEPYPQAEELLAAVGVSRSGLPVEAYRNGPTHVYIELPDEDAVAALRPDMARLAQLEGVAANCFAGSGRRWKTRMFAPALGIAEDPASGSAAGPLAMHLVRHGRIRRGEEVEIHQGVEVGRPSILFARADGSESGIETVEVAGAAVIVARGEFTRW